MDASEERIEDELNLNIEIKREIEVAPSVSLEIVTIKDEPRPVDLIKMTPGPNTLGKSKLYHCFSYNNCVVYFRC